MQTTHKHRFVIVIDCRCEICDSILRDAIEVSEGDRVVMELCGFINLFGVQIAVRGKSVTAACPHCWEQIRNG